MDSFEGLAVNQTDCSRAESSGRFRVCQAHGVQNEQFLLRHPCLVTAYWQQPAPEFVRVVVDSAYAGEAVAAALYHWCVYDAHLHS
eukprot:4589750-Amphidinium_carterae.1